MSSNPAGSPSPRNTGTTILRQFSDKELRDIGESCKNTLPPASAVQAMFLYEMQRQSESEKLFHGVMFELARVQESESELEKTLTSMQSNIASVTALVKNKDVEERIALSKTRMDSLASNLKQMSQTLTKQADTIAEIATSQATAKEKIGKLNHQIAEIKSSESSGTVLSKLDTTIKQQREHTSALAEHDKQLSSLGELVSSVANMLKSTDKYCRTNTSDLHVRVMQANAMAASATASFSSDAIDPLKAAIESCDGDIGVLFDERDAVVTELQLAKDRIAKLEDLMRALTVQTSPVTTATTSPALSQVLPVATSDGQPLNLCVPKGKPHVSFVPPHRSGNRGPGSDTGSM